MYESIRIVGILKMILRMIDKLGKYIYEIIPKLIASIKMVEKTYSNSNSLEVWRMGKVVISSGKGGG